MLSDDDYFRLTTEALLTTKQEIGRLQAKYKRALTTESGDGAVQKSVLEDLDRERKKILEIH